jgi:hypothetical protein
MLKLLKVPLTASFAFRLRDHTRSAERGLLRYPLIANSDSPSQLAVLHP